MDPDQTAPLGLGPHCLFMRLKIFQWTTKNVYTFCDYAI